MRALTCVASAALVTTLASTTFAQDAAAPAAPPPSPYGNMNAGGLAPPPPEDGAPKAAATEAPTSEQLDESKKKDAGRGLSWVWLEAEGGFEHVGLQTLTADPKALSVGLVPTVASGGVVGAGLGVRLLFLTIGGRARVGFFGPWQLFSAGGELGIHIPIGAFEPKFELGGGYAALGSVTGAVSGDSGAIQIHGFYARAGGGLDYYVTHYFSVGANASIELLGLVRPGLDPSAIASINQSQSIGKSEKAALSANGSSYGGALAITGVAGLHF